MKLPNETRAGVRQVALLAGVSVATVSRVFNDVAGVSERARDRVLAAAKRLNYVPNSAARALTLNRTYTIGVIVPTLEHSIFAGFLHSLESHLSGAGYGLVVATCDGNPQVEEERANRLLKMGAEALVLSGIRHESSLIDLLRARSVPFVFNSIHTDDPRLPTIGYDNYNLGRLAAGHLLELGHRRVAILSGYSQQNDRTELRVRGATDALLAGGLPEHRISHHSMALSVAEACRSAAQLASAAARPSALLCLSDVLAQGVLLELPRQGLRVPEDISVVGFDDLEWAQYTNPPLTTIRLPSQRMGIEIARALIQSLESGTVVQSLLLESELIVRSSTAVAPAAPEEG